MVEGVLRPERPVSGARGLRAHPLAPLVLRTLFFTGIRERFSDYGMRALPVLFMVAAIENDGLGMDERTATAVCGLCTVDHG